MTDIQWLKGIKIFRYTDAEKYFEQIAVEFLENAEKAIKDKGCFVAVLGGGNTPKNINSKIVELNSKYKVDWSKVYIILSDERWVKEQDALSNYRMILETLVCPLNVKLCYNIYLADKTIKEGAEAYSDYIDALLKSVGQEEFDYALLGVGNDGHTASLFPGRNSLAEKGKQVICGGKGPEGTERISLSYEALNKCKIASFLVNNPEKEKILHLMEKEWNPGRYPIQNIRVPKNMYLLQEEQL